jgi:TolB-like protein
LARFLRFIVERTLEGRSEEIKELVLATEVFDRGADFDPRESTIVRTEARRLRQRLEDYYRTGGRDDPIQIELPKGTYVPAIRERSVPAPPSRKPTLRAMSWARTALALLVAGLATAACWSAWRRYGPLFPTREATFAVMPFQELSGEAGEGYIALAARGVMLWKMNRIRGMRVAAVARDQVRAEADAAAVGKRFRAAFVVEGAARRSANQIRIRAWATELRTGRTIWEGDTEGPISHLPQWSGAMVLDLARNAGFRVSREERWEASEARNVRPPDALLHFWRGAYLLGGGSPGGLAAAIGELKQAVAIDPSLPEAWDQLAYGYYHLNYARTEGAWQV